MRVGSTSVFPVATVRDLGVYLDADVSMAAHVTATMKVWFAAFRQIPSVRRSLSPRYHCVHPVLINTAPRAAHFHSFCLFSYVINFFVSVYHYAVEEKDKGQGKATARQW